ncbi:MAG TPA: hypothetical protein VK956_18970, partial [Verrucomicrobium sp.]|nr:hypothetical protein [Verrucomicrobium sp.]
RVARDSIDTSEFKRKAEERDALASMALADLAAELGMPAPAAAAPTGTEAGAKDAGARSMGPQSEGS